MKLVRYSSRQHPYVIIDDKEMILHIRYYNCRMLIQSLKYDSGKDTKHLIVETKSLVRDVFLVYPDIKYIGKTKTNPYLP